MPRDGSLAPRDLADKLDVLVPRSHYGFNFLSDGSLGRLILVARRPA